jgi:hypothetical protein
LENLGHRTQAWSNKPQTAGETINDRLLLGSASASKTPAASRLLFSPSSSRVKENAGQNEPAPAKTAKEGIVARKLPIALIEHSRVIHRLNCRTFASKTSTSQDSRARQQQLSTLSFRESPATELVECVNDFASTFSELGDQGFKSNGDLIGYKTCLQLLNEMISGGEFGFQSSVNTRAGYFSPVCLHEEDYAQDTNSSLIKEAIKDRRKVLTSGAKMFFEKQFEQIMIDKTTAETDQSYLNGNTPLPKPQNLGLKVAMLQRFIELKRRARTIPDVCMYSTIVTDADDSETTETPLWPLIAVCFRIGDLSTAAEILKMAAEDDSLAGIEAEIIFALEGYIELISTTVRSSNPTDATRANIGTPEFRSRFRQAISECRNLFAKAQLLVPSGTNVPHAYKDPYRMDVLNLLSLASVADLSEHITGSSLEDYLWCHLWYVKWSRELYEFNIFSPTANTISNRDRYYVPATFR